tara:strand:- start:1367 stop:1768 length:402 start_codon:yes stop_codon:yes gene_type:complete
MIESQRTSATVTYLAHRYKWERGTSPTGWKERHAAAWPTSSIGRLTTAAVCYADDYKIRYGGDDQYPSVLGSDYVLGDAWFQMVDGIRTLLNGSLGDLDGGLCDALLVALLEGEGFDVDNSVISTRCVNRRGE